MFTQIKYLQTFTLYNVLIHQTYEQPGVKLAWQCARRANESPLMNGGKRVSHFLSYDIIQSAKLIICRNQPIPIYENYKYFLISPNSLRMILIVQNLPNNLNTLFKFTSHIIHTHKLKPFK